MSFNLDKPYEEWSSDEKHSFFKSKYDKEKLSLAILANMTNTYVNKIRRDLTKLGYQVRSKKEAAKIAVKEGRITSPTKGKKIPQKVKEKISESKAKSWENLSEKEKEKIRQDAKERFENWEKKDDFIKAGARAISKASSEGSKLEKFLMQGLEDAGYIVECHAEQIVGKENMHIDLYIPELMLAIEVDGPSHFKPIFGEEKLLKSQETDRKKNDKILAAGFRLIRVKQTKNLTVRSKNYLLSEILLNIDSEEEYLEIGDDEDAQEK